ncbi:hypothetical protein INT48_005898 [Thamnidium elegans]|uniref:Mannosyltransferase n=1 Tax=Thamnidium elegans TaxID=101142 RepID=A0A8H7VRR0_9FUNG|nr:hypothetical protein INT48_005898 [Thamnidium elegans]
MLKKTVLIISFLLWTRWLISSLPGYIHPDEFFQNPEITSSKIFDLDTFTPWEYSPEHASRSIVAPFITTGIPFWLLKSLTPEGTYLCVYKLCNHIGKKPTLPMILVATSQVTLAYYTHPFSNSFESILLCLSLCTYADFVSKPSNKLSFLLGALFSLGVFTRITFPLYALPIGIAYLYQAYKKSDNVGQVVNSVFPLFAGMLAFAVFCIVADSVYYGTLTFTVREEGFKNIGQVISTLFNPIALASVRSEGSIVVTPLNNLLYNLNVDNLAQHGIHPYYTHFVVNLPLLFGPLAIFALMYMPSTFARIRNDTNAHLFYVFVGVFFSGLIGLSIMPHQEARFLCPLLVPLVMIYTWKQKRLSPSFWAAWFLFNVITTYVFGVIHQGGLVSSMGFLNRQTNGLHDCYVLQNDDLSCAVGSPNLKTKSDQFNITTNLVFYKTYMPPRHLLVIPKENDNSHVNIFDFASHLDQVVEQLEKSSGVTLRRHDTGKPEVDFAKTSTRNAFERTLFITPSFVSLPKIPHHRYMLLTTYSPHMSFDDIDKMIEMASETNSPESQMNLNVFLILSDKDDI